MLESITPVILTFNEAPNIGRTLSSLGWAKEIIVVDSDSTDGTIAMCKADPRIRLFVRKFVSHHDQWQFAIDQTDIKTPWILRLDADYQIPKSLTDELAKLDLSRPETAYRVGFDYAIYGKTLAHSLYPPKAVLLRRGFFSVLDGGHTETWDVRGSIGQLKARIIHDDWKAMPGWIGAQTNYMRRELALNSLQGRGFTCWLRSRPPLMMVAVFFYCLFAKGLIFDGKRGIMYTLQRTVAEGIYGLLYLERECAPSSSGLGQPELPKVEEE